jgi:hypothetical protein
MNRRLTFALLPALLIACAPNSHEADISPKRARVFIGESVAFKISGSDPAQAKRWSIREPGFGGSVSGDGLFRAPLDTGTYHVAVTIDARTISAEVEVTACTQTRTRSDDKQVFYFGEGRRLRKIERYGTTSYFVYNDNSISEYSNFSNSLTFSETTRYIKDSHFVTSNSIPPANTSEEQSLFDGANFNYFPGFGLSVSDVATFDHANRILTIRGYVLDGPFLNYSFDATYVYDRDRLIKIIKNEFYTLYSHVEWPSDTDTLEYFYGQNGHVSKVVETYTWPSGTFSTTRTVSYSTCEADLPYEVDHLPGPWNTRLLDLITAFGSTP